MESQVSLLDHISQTYIPSSNDSANGFSHALVQAYSALLAQQQDPHGVLVSSVEGTHVRAVIDVCLEGLIDNREKTLSGPTSTSQPLP